jgi:phosphatidylinositol glycan class K
MKRTLCDKSFERQRRRIGNKQSARTMSDFRRMFGYTLFVLLFVSTRASRHTSNHAVIVSSSRYWFNYRHAINALSIYQLVKENGIPDENILLMLADDFPTNARNPYKNQLFGNDDRLLLYNESLNVQIDYRGDDVTIETMIRAMTGRHEPGYPVLHTNADSHVLVYWSGHGGDQFFKFQDYEEILSKDINALFHQMTYREILFVADTCQAFTLGDHIDAPNVTIIGSSLKGESSYAYHSNDVLGVSVTERYTYALVEYLKRDGLGGSLQQSMIDPFPFSSQGAHIGASDKLSVRKLDQVRVSDFFANVQTIKAQKPKATTTVILLNGTRERVFRLPPPRFYRERVSEKQRRDDASVSSSQQQCVGTEHGENVCAARRQPLVVGVEPTNPAFLISLVTMLATVFVASRNW